jgi:hypothetical protein
MEKKITKMNSDDKVGPNQIGNVPAVKANSCGDINSTNSFFYAWADVKKVLIQKGDQEIGL